MTTTLSSILEEQEAVEQIPETEQEVSTDVTEVTEEGSADTEKSLKEPLEDSSDT